MVDQAFNIEETMKPKLDTLNSKISTISLLSKQKEAENENL